MVTAVVLALDPPAPSVTVVAKLPVVAPPVPPALLLLAVVLETVELESVLLVVAVLVTVVAVVLVVVLVTTSPDVAPPVVVAAAVVLEVTALVALVLAVCVTPLPVIVVVELEPSVVETSAALVSTSPIDVGSSTTVAHAMSNQTVWKARAPGAARCKFEEACELVTGELVAGGLANMPYASMRATSVFCPRRAYGVDMLACESRGAKVGRRRARPSVSPVRVVRRPLRSLERVNEVVEARVCTPVSRTPAGPW